MSRIGAIPSEFDIPVVWCALDRRTYAADHPDASPEELRRDAYSVCTVACIMQAEIYMRGVEDEKEVCSIVIEQNHELQRGIPGHMEFLRNPGPDAARLFDGAERVMPLQRIIDSASYQPKTGSNILQLADYCAFAIKRRVQDSRDSAKLTNAIASQFLRYADPTDLGSKERRLWNPRFMPAQWNHGATYKDGKFFLKKPK